MYALERRCLLLKDKRMPRLPTDICGKIYKDFDTYDLKNSVESRVKDWCEKDLCLIPTEKREFKGSALDKYISEYVDTSPFKKRQIFDDHISIVLREYDNLGDTVYIVWNERKKHLFKFCKEGVSWYGPDELDDKDEKKVRDLLNIRL